MNAIISPDYYYVLTVAGQSNAMAYGEGLPLPDREDAPHPRIKQLARFAHTHPGGPSCHFNDIIPLTHCPHVVVAARLLSQAAKGHIQNGTEPAMMLVVGERILRYTRI